MQYSKANKYTCDFINIERGGHHGYMKTRTQPGSKVAFWYVFNILSTNIYDDVFCVLFFVFFLFSIGSFNWFPCLLSKEKKVKEKERKKKRKGNVNTWGKILFL